MTVLPTPDGRMKDTGVNTLETQEFVVDLVSEMLAEAMNVTCIDAPANVDELTIAGLKSAPSIKVRPPRVADSPVSLECRLHTAVPLGPNQIILIGRIVHAHVADNVMNEVRPDTGDKDRVSRWVVLPERLAGLSWA